MKLRTAVLLFLVPILLLTACGSSAKVTVLPAGVYSLADDDGVSIGYMHINGSKVTVTDPDGFILAENVKCSYDTHDEEFQSGGKSAFTLRQRGTSKSPVYAMDVLKNDVIGLKKGDYTLTPVEKADAPEPYSLCDLYILDRFTVSMRLPDELVPCYDAGSKGYDAYVEADVVQGDDTYSVIVTCGVSDESSADSALQSFLKESRYFSLSASVDDLAWSGGTGSWVGAGHIRHDYFDCPTVSLFAAVDCDDGEVLCISILAACETADSGSSEQLLESLTSVLKTATLNDSDSE